MKTVIALIVVVALTIVSTIVIFDFMIVHSVQTIINQMRHIGGTPVKTIKQGKLTFTITEFQPINAATIGSALVGLILAPLVYFLAIAYSCKLGEWIMDSPPRRVQGEGLSAKQVEQNYKSIMDSPPVNTIEENGQQTS